MRGSLTDKIKPEVSEGVMIYFPVKQHDNKKRFGRHAQRPLPGRTILSQKDTLSADKIL